MKQNSIEDLAQFCIDSLKDSKDVFVDTLYIAITNSNKVICSKTPHILRQANKCILLNLVSKGFYTINYIDEEGQVTDGNLGNGFKLMAPSLDSTRKPRIKLLYNEIVLCSFCLPWEDCMQKMWNVYCKANKLSSEGEMKMMAELIKRDEKILEQGMEIENLNFTNQLLEKERNLYMNLLNEIREIVEKK